MGQIALVMKILDSKSEMDLVLILTNAWSQKSIHVTLIMQIALILKVLMNVTVLMVVSKVKLTMSALILMNAQQMKAHAPP
jgi:hypothetical protein